MKPALFILMFLATASAASAQPYAAAKVAYANADIPAGAPYNGVIEDNAFGIGFDVGLGFGRRWAAEFGAMRYASFDGQGAPCAPGDVCTLAIRPISGNDMTLYTAAVVRRFMIGNVNLFGRLGYYRADIDTNIGLPGSDFREDGIAAAVGMRWYFSNPWSVSLEASRFDDNIRQFAVGFGWGLRRDRD